MSDIHLNRALMMVRTQAAIGDITLPFDDGNVVPPLADSSGALYAHLVIGNNDVNIVIDRDPLDQDCNLASLNAIATGSNLFAFNGVCWDRLRSAGDNADALTVSTLGILRVNSENYGFNGASWDRLRSGANNADAVASLALGVLDNNAFAFGFNGASWDRLRSGANNVDNIAATALGNLNALAFNYIWDGANWDRLTGTGGALSVVGNTADNADAVAVTTNAALRTTAEVYGFNGTTFDRIRSQGNSADNLAAVTLGLVETANYLYAFNRVGSNFQRLSSSRLDQDNITSLTTGTLVTQANLLGYDVTNNVWSRVRVGVGNGDGATPFGAGVLYTVAYTYGVNPSGTLDRMRVSANNADAQAVTTLGVQINNACTLGFNGTTFDRIRSGGNNANALATSTLGILSTQSFNYVFNGATWDRWTGAVTISGAFAGGTADNADAVAVTTNAALRTTAEVYGFNGTTFDRIRSGGNNVDNVAPVGLGVLASQGFNYIFTGDAAQAWQRIRAGSGQNLSAVSQTGLALVTSPGGWSLTDTPAAGVTAQVQKAAPGAGFRHVVTSLCVTCAYGGAPGLVVNATLNDGSGIVWATGISTVGAPLQSMFTVPISSLNIVARAANTAVTFTCVAPSLTSRVTVSMTGYTVPE